MVVRPLPLDFTAIFYLLSVKSSGRGMRPLGALNSTAGGLFHLYGGETFC